VIFVVERDTMKLDAQHPLTSITMFDSGIIIDDTIMVIADTHFGFEESVAPGGLLGSVDTNKKLMQKIETLIKKYRPTQLIFNGDLKHEFTKLPSFIYRWLEQFFSTYSKQMEIIVIPGNHDASVIEFLKKQPIIIKPHVTYKSALICHGDILFEERLQDPEINTVIVGHQHPAISLRMGIRDERYKCFLYGKTDGRNVLVLPCFHPLRTGANIITEESITPYIHNADLDSYHVYVVEEEVYDFKTIKEIKEINAG